MKPGDLIVLTDGREMRFIEHPLHYEAHPEDDPDAFDPNECCEGCAWAEYQGQRFLLWRSNKVVWSLSRADKTYRRTLAAKNPHPTP